MGRRHRFCVGATSSGARVRHRPLLRRGRPGLRIGRGAVGVVLCIGTLSACAASTAPRLRVIPSTVQLRATASTIISPAEQLVELPPLEGSTTTSTIAFPGGRVKKLENSSALATMPTSSMK